MKTQFPACNAIVRCSVASYFSGDVTVGAELKANEDAIQISDHSLWLLWRDDGQSLQQHQLGGREREERGWQTKKGCRLVSQHSCPVLNSR